MRAAANAVLIGAAKCLWPRSRPLAAKRVCIYRIGNIGDIACAMPAMRAIRRAYPDAHLTLVTSPGKAGAAGARELLASAGWIDELVVYHSEDIATARGRLTLLGEMRARNFDVWIELPVVAAPLAALFRNMLVARLAGARWGFGWRYQRLRLFASAQSEFLLFPDEVDRLLDIVVGCGLTARSEDTLFDLNQTDRDHAADVLESSDLSGEGIIGFAPGAKAEPNCWPAERFIEVGRYLASSGFKIVVLGGAADAQLCGKIAASIGRGAASLAGKSTLGESCGILARCALLICNDSGVQHLAASVGTPCVSIFSRRDFLGQWWPHGDAHEVLWRAVPCHTCLLELCPYDNKCIKLIEVADAISAAERVLARASNRKSETGLRRCTVA